MDMAEPLSLSLHAWPRAETSIDPLPSTIARINQQRGHFRNVTEQLLEAEIKASREQGDRAAEGNGDIAGTADEDDTTKTSDLRSGREELIRQVSQAHIDALHALDFVSLLLSRDAPKQAEISISPSLKQSLPLGSLGVDRVQSAPVAAADQRDHDLVSIGWKLHSLNSAADVLLDSASKLEKEIGQESRYWEQVLSVKEDGWSVCRMPREKHTLGVRLGFSEAVPEFHDRGLVPLRRDEEGIPVLDRSLLSTQSKCVRVRFLKNGRLKGTSRHPSRVNFSSLKGAITLARDTLFEEELFHELLKEARTLANHGVRIRGSTISVEGPHGQVLLIDLVEVDHDESLSNQKPKRADVHATILVLLLRIYLCYGHRQSFYRRSHLPPPITDRKRPRPIHHILRPLLAQMQQRLAFHRLSSTTSRLVSTVQSSGLPCSYSIPSNSANRLNSAVTGRPAIEVVLQGTFETLENSISLTLPSFQSPVELQVRTNLFQGSEYILTLSGTTAASLGLSTVSSFSFPDELNKYLYHLVNMSLVTFIIDIKAHSTSGNPDPKAINEEGWQSSQPVGQLVKSYPNTGRVKQMLIKVSECKIQLSWYWMNGSDRKNNGEGSYTWDGNAGSSAKTLEDVVELAGKYNLGKVAT